MFNKTIKQITKPSDNQKEKDNLRNDNFITFVKSLKVFKTSSGTLYCC